MKLEKVSTLLITTSLRCCPIRCVRQPARSDHHTLSRRRPISSDGFLCDLSQPRSLDAFQNLVRGRIMNHNFTDNRSATVDRNCSWGFESCETSLPESGNGRPQSRSLLYCQKQTLIFDQRRGKTNGSCSTVVYGALKMEIRPVTLMSDSAASRGSMRVAAPLAETFLALRQRIVSLYHSTDSIHRGGGGVFANSRHG